jgi:citrate synthase
MLKKIGSQDPERWLDDALAKKAKIMGFGHRVYKTGDPRARWLHKMSRDLTKARPARRSSTCPSGSSAR